MSTLSAEANTVAALHRYIDSTLAGAEAEAKQTRAHAKHLTHENNTLRAGLMELSADNEMMRKELAAVHNFQHQLETSQEALAGSAAENKMMRTALTAERNLRKVQQEQLKEEREAFRAFREQTKALAVGGERLNEERKMLDEAFRGP